MQTFLVIEVKVATQPLLRFTRRGVLLQVYFFILHRPPQALCEDVVQGSPLAVHTDLRPALLEQIEISLAREVRPLIRVEDVRHTPSQGVAHGTQYKWQFH